MERRGRRLTPSWGEAKYCKRDPVDFIIGLNIHRHHLTKQQRADLIVAAVRASRQLGEVPKRHVKGKPGSEKDAPKAKAVAVAKDHGISKRTIERAFEKASDHPKRADRAKTQGGSAEEQSRQPISDGAGDGRGLALRLHQCLQHRVP
jgi:hypothetical protein